MLVVKQRDYRNKMKSDSKRRANWKAVIGMSVNGRDPKRKKSEINKLEFKSSKSAALFKYPGVIISFVGGDAAAVKWGEKGGPKKEEAGEVTVVHNYLSNLRPRVTCGGEEFVRFPRGTGGVTGDGGHGARVRTGAHGDASTSAKRRRDEKVRLLSNILYFVVMKVPEPIGMSWERMSQTICKHEED
jgi:hypothetical protein